MSIDGFPRPKQVTRVEAPPDVPQELPVTTGGIESGPKASITLPVARELLAERFEKTTDPDNQLPYHNTEHTEGVVRRALRIAEALGATERETELITLAGSFHDTVQDWEEQELPGGQVKRKRLVERNEAASADEAEAYMRQSSRNYTDEEVALVRKAITATIPGFDMAIRTVVQPKHNLKASNIERAVALADIGTAGMEPEVYATEGTKLFAEENLDITRAIRVAGSPDAIPESVQASYLKRYQGWMAFQVDFANGRRDDTFSNFIEYYGITKDPERGEKMRKLFDNFEKSVELATKNAKEASNLSFEEFAKRMVPDAFSKRETAST